MPAQGFFSALVPASAASSSNPRLRLYGRILSIWLSLSGYRWALAVIIALAWILRAFHPHFSSAYMDESIYVLYGRMFLSHHFEAPIDQPLHFSFGWYVWPILATWADRIGGLAGIRELAAALGTLTVLSVYAFARRLFSPAVGLASAMVFAFLGPAVLASRIATRDIGSIFFFSVGIWLFVRTWQEEKWPSWLAASLLMFAAFLCKYLIAIYFPFLVLLALWKGRRGTLFFSLPLMLLCGGYAFFERENLLALLRYGHAYNGLRASTSTAWQIYFTHRPDFWLLVVLAVFAWPRGDDKSGRKVALLSAGVALIPVFQIFSRADYDYWKHVNYSFLFLVPIAMYGLLRVIRNAMPAYHALLGTILVGLLAVSLGWIGNAWRIDRFLFWPNTEPAIAYFEGRLASDDRVLVDDTVFRYYFSPPLHQWQIVDPFYFRYGSETGTPAYAAAIREGWFDYVVLDGGVGDEAKRLRAAIAPGLAGRYALRVRTLDPALGQTIEIYARQNPPARTWESSGPRIEIDAPAPGAAVRTENDTTTLSATIHDIQSGDYALVDVFTNRWYQQGGRIQLDASGTTFSQRIDLGGEGLQRCYHIVRARVFDSRNRFLASAMNFNVIRANPDGTNGCQ